MWKRALAQVIKLCTSRPSHVWRQKMSGLWLFGTTKLLRTWFSEWNTFIGIAFETYLFLYLYIYFIYLFIRLFLFIFIFNYLFIYCCCCCCCFLGVGIAQLIQHRTRDRKVASSIPESGGGRISSPELIFCADSHSVSFPPPCYRSGT